MKTYELIKKWRLNMDALAAKIGLSRNTFFPKIDPKYSAKFTRNQKIDLHQVLIEMGADLVELQSHELESSTLSNLEPCQYFMSAYGMKRPEASKNEFTYSKIIECGGKLSLDAYMALIGRKKTK